MIYIYASMNTKLWITIIIKYIQGSNADRIKSEETKIVIRERELGGGRKEIQNEINTKEEQKKTRDQKYVDRTITHIFMTRISYLF